MINLIFIGVLSTVCLILLIYVAYAWFVDGGRTSATNITFNTDEQKMTGFGVTVVGPGGRGVSVSVLPDEITELEMTMESSTIRNVNVNMRGEMHWKEVNWTNYTVKTELVENDANSYQTTNLDKYYLVNEYYDKLTDEKVELSDTEKRDIFRSFYESSVNNYNIINKVKYYISDTKIEENRYYEDLISKLSLVENNPWKNVGDGFDFDTDVNQGGYEVATEFEEGMTYYSRSGEGTELSPYVYTKENGVTSANFSEGTYYTFNNYRTKLYVYFYFDPTDEKFYYDGEDANLTNYYFLGQNPYFYQWVKFDILITENE